MQRPVRIESDGGQAHAGLFAGEPSLNVVGGGDKIEQENKVREVGEC